MSERWVRIQELLAGAADLDPEARTAFLASGCGGDETLQREVEDLLEAAGQADSYFEGLARRLGGNALAHVPDAVGTLAGRELGPYRLISLLGRGGMGAVYLGERVDGQFEKQVAVKLLPLGMDSNDARRRFLVERQLLAHLEHPNISRLLDGGVAEDGTPWFVMERVEGRPIDRYCDEEGLTIAQRLSLFLDVCRAVQYAHQNLVVHRDLKPSNIVVTAEGRVKLLDFGIATLVSGETGPGGPQTQHRTRLLTPRFAAPEQLRGGPITTATDVYALGVLLYELLTGAWPYGPYVAGALEVERVVLGIEPAPPSSLAPAEGGRGTSAESVRRRLRGDVDRIVLKSLEKEPERRYPAAQHLIDDLTRHVEGLPILARRPTRRYRLRKFVSRHRAGVAAGALVVLSLLGGLGGSAWQAQRAAEQRDVAELERAKAERVTEFLLGLFDAADPLGAGAERTDTLPASALVDRGTERIELELADQPELQAELLATLGRVYANLGLYERGEQALSRAAALQEGGDGGARTVTLAHLARIALERNDFARADSLYGRVLAEYVAGERVPDSLFIAILSERGVASAYMGEYDVARALHERAFELSVARAGGAEGLGLLHHSILRNLASLHFDLSEHAEAEILLRQVLAFERGRSHPDHPFLASTLSDLASMIHYQGRHAEAEPVYREAIEIAQRTLGPSHSELANYLQNLATLYDDLGRYDEAEPLYREGRRIYEEAFGDGSRTAMLLRNFALNRLAVGERGEAEELLRQADAALRRELGLDHLHTLITSAALGRILTPTEHLEEGLERLETAFVGLEEQLPAGHFLLEATRRDLGAAHAAAGRLDVAEPLLLDSYEALLADRGPEHYLTVEAREHLRLLYLARGEPERAALYVATRS